MVVQVLDTGHLPDGGKTLWINDLKGKQGLNPQGSNTQDVHMKEAFSPLYAMGMCIFTVWECRHRHARHWQQRYGLWAEDDGTAGKTLPGVLSPCRTELAFGPILHWKNNVRKTPCDTG